LNRRGPKPILDDTKKREIVAILSVGCTRRTAALYVGCSPRTIRRTAQRDQRFAHELRAASQTAEINYLRNIQNAAKKEQYWRAAAWALERCHPEQYAARRADCVTLQQVRELLAELTQIIVEEVPRAEYRKAILKRLGSLMKGFCLMRQKSPK
jgi:hypothetical protein